MIRQLVKVAIGVVLCLLLLSCGVVNRLQRYTFTAPPNSRYRVYVKNRETGKVYLGHSNHSLSVARSNALRLCHIGADALNVCQLVEAVK